MRVAPAESHKPSSEEPAMPTVRIGRLVAAALVGLGLWLIPVPVGVEPGAWKLLAIFVQINISWPRMPTRRLRSGFSTGP